MSLYNILVRGDWGLEYWLRGNLLTKFVLPLLHSFTITQLFNVPLTPTIKVPPLKPPQSRVKFIK